MEAVSILRALGSLAIVLGLIGCCAYIARRWPLIVTKAQRSGPPRRLTIVERLILDPRRQVVVVRDGRREHVLLIGASGEHVIESRDFVRSIPRPGDGGEPVPLRPTPAS